MSGSSFNLSEHAAARRAVLYLDAGYVERALDWLRGFLRSSELQKPEGLSNVPRVRAHIEQAVVEIERGVPIRALNTLRRALADGSEQRVLIQ